MQTRLRQILDGLATPDQLQLICDACAVLEELNYREHESDIEQLIARPDTETGQVVYDIIEQILKPALAGYLRATGITVSDEITLADLKDLVFWVVRIENYEEQDAINGIATSDESAEDNLAEILALVSATPAERFSVLLDSVSDSLIDRIAELTDGKETPILPDSRDFDRAKQRTLRYVNWLETTDPDTYAMLDLSGLRLGLSSEVILSLHRDQLAAIEPKRCAKLLMLYLLSSDIDDEQILPAIGVEAELLYENIVQGMELTRAARALAGQLTNA